MKVSTGYNEPEPENVPGFYIENAPEEAVKFVLGADQESNDGRSQWVWVRLQNGDLVLAVFPQGDTYFHTEQWRSI